jgi:dihydroflavonol-4-reductase
MDVSVLELPYIFGAQPGRKPVWVFLVEQIQKMKGATFYPAGGTTMVTVKQVGQCIAGALERGRGGKNYPIGYYNLPRKSWQTRTHYTVLTANHGPQHALPGHFAVDQAAVSSVTL